MKLTLIFIEYSFIFSVLHETLSLKCRAGNQQSDEQFQKIVQICRRRYLGYEGDTDSQESSDSRSEEDLLDGKFLASAAAASGRGYNYKNSEKIKSSRYDYTSSSLNPRNATRQSSSRNWSGSSGSSSNGNGNRSPYDDAGHSSSGRRSSLNYGNRNIYNNYNAYGNASNDGDREQACVVQCFFNELNLVDQRGFPERSAVVSIMTQNLQDPELRDFVEESVMECYHYLNNSGRQEKCQFSLNLLSCLAEKGNERCEDWDDE